MAKRDSNYTAQQLMQLLIPAMHSGRQMSSDMPDASADRRILIKHLDQTWFPVAESFVRRLKTLNQEAKRSSLPRKVLREAQAVIDEFNDFFVNRIVKYNNQIIGSEGTTDEAVLDIALPEYDPEDPKFQANLRSSIKDAIHKMGERIRQEKTRLGDSLFESE